MRLFALERFSGTFETLMTAPVGDAPVVLAKFLRRARILSRHVAADDRLPVCHPTLHRQTGALDPATLGSTYLGITLIGALFMSLGLSRLRPHPQSDRCGDVDADAGHEPVLVGVLATKIPVAEQWQTQVLGYLAFFQQMADFSGALWTRARSCCT